MTDGHVLVVNAGSSSLKLSVLGPADTVITALDIDPWDGTAGDDKLAAFTAGLTGVTAVGHRVVHGGSAFRSATRIDPATRGAIAGLTSLAPLHQPRAIAGIDAAGHLLPGVAAVACFDTAFHARMPPAAAAYALPAAWRDRYGLRRYGFHGLSHSYAARHAAAMLGRPLAGLRLVTCHLGGGASLAAIAGGVSVDTTMGFTPLEGLVMSTRSGSVDPGLLVWLLREGGIGLDELADGIEHEAGLAGLAGLPDGSGDMRQVHASAQAGNHAAQLAIDVYNHRLRREIAAMTAALGGLDALVFTGGVGEHHPAVRSAAADRLGYLGVAIDPDRNLTAQRDADITAAGAPARTLVITAREDIEIARQTRDLLR